MQKLDDATAQITFLAMVADLERAWELRSREPDQFEGALWKIYLNWWPVFFDEDWPYPSKFPDADFGNAAVSFSECFCRVFGQVAKTCKAGQLVEAFIAYMRTLA